jgi:hypothetical protein
MTDAIPCGVVYPGYTEPGSITITPMPSGSLRLDVAGRAISLYPWQAAQLAAALTTHPGDGTS